MIYKTQTKKVRNKKYIEVIFAQRKSGMNCASSQHKIYWWQNFSWVSEGKTKDNYSKLIPKVTELGNQTLRKAKINFSIYYSGASGMAHKR